MLDWTVLDSAEQVAQIAVAAILKQAKQAIASKGVFHLVTAGGTTPMRCYELLLEKDAEIAHLDKWHIYMGDERVLPADDAERNSLALVASWLSKSSIPKENWHLMATENGVEKAQESYKKIVDEIMCFDVVMLGMGEDGHTASIFPNHVYQEDSVVIERNSPKMPPERISLSVARLSQAELVIKLITGSGKKQACSQIQQGATLPITLPEGKTTLILLDEAAMPV